MTKIKVKTFVYLLISLPALLFIILPTVLGDLGLKPWKTLLKNSGFCTVGLLFLSLSLAPIKKHFPRVQFFKNLNRFRREIGLAVFIYACCHFLFFIMDAIVRKGHLQVKYFFHPVIFPGFLAFLIFAVLAFTSNDRSIRKLGYNKWKGLHRFVYGAELLVFIHLLLQSPLIALSIFIPLIVVQRVRIHRSCD